ncbi:MAG TPA: sigma 54-interacting transcriptional regulator [Polyangiaceae bacterium]|jgi:two-component system response regulator GlrR
MTLPASEELTKINIRAEPAVAVQRRRFRLRLDRGAGPRTDLTSGEERIIIGRGPQADLVIDDEAVSRIHCEIVWEGDSLVLRDLGSKNGTWLAGIRVREVCLPAEARIGIGDAEVAFGMVSGVEELRLHPDSRFGRLIGESNVMRAAFDRLARIAARDTTLLLEGESGTGKELAAEAVHESSGRRDGPFVVVDCGSIPRTLLEAELFGHERGAYTGASQARPGAFVRANGGTIFLDEVGELDIDLQPRLLRVLERREVKPIGGAQPLTVDVRIIAATNRDLRRDVNRGAFREDLYYRLAVACVRLPPLRERVNDIPLLVKNFLDEHSRRDAVEYALEDGVSQRLMMRPWPGNVRELRNVVEQIVAFGIEEVSLVEAPEQAAPIDLPFKVAKAQLVERFEREYLVSVLAQHGGNITAAASAAELDRVHFLRLLDRYGLRKSGTRSA